VEFRLGSMESLVKGFMDEFWKSKRVLITGHTGFKGSWLACWLQYLGADVWGYSLPPATRPNHFEALDLDIHSRTGDIRDLEALESFLAEVQPEIVFHLAAQSLVRRSYAEPIQTFETNVMGTLNVFEACRNCESVRAIVNVTSDKCYENSGEKRGYVEEDRMGGKDPYSASKGCAELLTASYRASYFDPERYGRNHHVLLASCRAGNVIGGGDWAEDRIVPDIVRGAAAGIPVVIRNPEHVRPWQHVLEPLSGYLLLGRRLLEGRVECAVAWNFGPESDDVLTVGELAAAFAERWEAVELSFAAGKTHLKEAVFLCIDSTKAKKVLGWKPRWNSVNAIERTVEWYRMYYEDGTVRTIQDIEAYNEV